MTTTRTSTIPMRQRAELTYKQNVHHGRHGWLRLTPAYSVRLVDQVLGEFGREARAVLEPFSGTGTTPLCAAYKGIRAVSTDINPFLIWLGRVKTARYSPRDGEAFKGAAENISSRLQQGQSCAGSPPALKNIDRWWSVAELEFVSSLHGEVERLSDGPVRNLLRVVFCRTMISLSNAAFNHQSMSFKDVSRLQMSLPLQDSSEGFLRQFREDVRIVESSCLDNPGVEVRIEQIDARELDKLAVAPGTFDLLVTSPPYPNRMSYIRELRPYMYWLGFLENAKTAGELDWEAIGGTWGIATSRLLRWEPTDAFIPDYLVPIIENIREAHPKNGELMAKYVHKYFDDMFHHFRTARPLIRAGGTVHYIVGNSAFYGHLVPSEKLYVDQLQKVGFRNAVARAIRKRNSKKELVEFHVIAER